MKIAFFGTPEFSVPFLQALDDDEELLVSAVICQPDKPVGRKKILTTPPTKQYALEHGIDVFQPASLKTVKAHDYTALQDTDIFVVVAYGKIIPQNILDIPKRGTINVHPSLLPKYRGPSPMQAAIANQDKQTGVSIMLLDDQMDHGPILAQKTIKLRASETYTDLQATVHAIAPSLLVETIKRYAAEEIKPQEQNHDAATFCKLLNREDGKIDWNEPARAIDAKRRAYTPWPGIWTILDGKRVKFPMSWVEPGKQEPGSIHIRGNEILVGTGDGLFATANIHLEGSPVMDIPTFLTGHTLDDKKFVW